MPEPLPTPATAAQLLRSGRAADAAALCAQLLRANPRQPAVLLQLALALRALRRPAEAIDALQRALALDPALAESHHQLGNLLKSLGRLSEATAALREATRLAPAHAPAWLNLGVALLDADQPAAAIDAFRRALALEPTRPEAHNILGVALLAAGRLADSRAALAEALRLRPGYAAAHDNLGRLARAEGRLADAVTHYRAALAAKSDPATHSNLLLALNYLDLPPEEIFAEHRAWHACYAAPLCPQPSTPDSQPQTPNSACAGRRLRIGYLSPDFAHHAVAYFIEPVLAAHDRTRVEIFCYANVRSPDAVTARLRALAEHWRDIAPLDDEAAAALIRADTLDLLIDLAGHTARHRLLVLARRPAPVQATWIGYPNTTGLDAVDYRLTDAVSDPPGETERYHTEKLVRLPTTFSLYQPDPTAPSVNALPAATTGAVTFGSFNNFAKLSPATLALWAQILRAVPGSRLLLKSRGLGDPGVAARLRSVFSDTGVDPARLALDGTELPVADHLALYHGVDLALDPFPYNGTTTTCEALWMGVPVVTLAGRTHVARVGASLLTHTGLTDWVAPTPGDYLALAARAAADLPHLAELRRTLRDRLRASPLCDALRFTRGLEDAFAAMIAGRIEGGN